MMACKHWGLIYETKGGYLDRDTGKSDITKYRITDNLKHLLEAIEGDPFKDIKPDLDEPILLRDRVDGKRVVIKYDDNHQTNAMRKNLRNINACLARHWPDLELTDDEFAQLQLRLIDDKNKAPVVDFSKRILTRIFSNGSFEQGGRFYRAWWHNVPSELRKYITIDSKRTCEYDYSQLNPLMIYFNAGKDMGSEDCYYDRVFDGEHRAIVKEAFNAMMQASSELSISQKALTSQVCHSNGTTSSKQSLMLTNLSQTGSSEVKAIISSL